jgi:putative endonuclease
LLLLRSVAILHSGMARISPTSQSAPAPVDGRKQLGALGEQETALFLERLDYRIVDANVRPMGGRKRGEIDLVAWNEDCLVFIEVKTRRAASNTGHTPAEAVDVRKRRRLVELANAYIARYALDDVPCRFDVVEVVRAGSETSLSLITNAFDAGDIS